MEGRERFGARPVGPPYAVDMDPARPAPGSDTIAGQAARLAAARADRTRPRATPTLSRMFLVQVPEMRRMRRQLSGIAAAWAEVVPAEIAEQVRLEGVTAGVLNVRAADASVRFQLDRFLRAGGEAQLLKRLPAAIRRVRIGLDAAPSPGAAGESRPRG